VPATVSAIIVNYNGEPFVLNCLSSVSQQSHPFEEIIVVDNASADGSLQLLQERFPEVTFVAMDSNVGFPAACNRGIREASSDLIAILNNDIILDERWLEALLAEEDSAWGFWASQIVFASEPQRIDSAGDGMAVVGAAYKIGHGEPVLNHSAPKEVFGPCAAAALYRRSLLDAVEGFDEDFFLVYEDADLNMRARLQGFRCLYVPTAVVHHMVNRSIGAFSHTYVYFGHRNSEHLFWKNMPTPLLWRFVPERILFDLLSFLYFSFKGRGLSFLRAKVDFLRQFPATLQKRRKIQTERTLSTSKLRAQLDRNWLRYRRKASVQL
jgi:GT2 family glycosyltransferase